MCTMIELKICGFQFSWIAQKRHMWIPNFTKKNVLKCDIKKL